MDYYNILNINKDASENDIKDAYKKLARKWHPDKNINNKEEAEKTFKKISEAYQVLSDKNKKYQYDNNGLNNNFNTNFVDPFSVFNNFFSGGSGFNTSMSFGSSFSGSFSSTSRSESYQNGNHIIKEKKNINGIVTETVIINGKVTSKKENGVEMIDYKKN